MKYFYYRCDQLFVYLYWSNVDKWCENNSICTPWIYICSLVFWWSSFYVLMFLFSSYKCTYHYNWKVTQRSLRIIFAYQETTTVTFKRWPIRSVKSFNASNTMCNRIKWIKFSRHTTFSNTRIKSPKIWRK